MWAARGADCLKSKGGVTPPLLRWKGIETTRALAEVANSQLIIVGGRDGLPLILNTETGGTTGK